MSNLLSDLVNTLIDNKPITNSYGDKYFVKSIDYITDQVTGLSGWKAIVTSRGYVYSSVNLAKDREGAILNTLLSLQSMGRFSSYRLSETSTEQDTQPKKKRSNTPNKPIPKKQDSAIDTERSESEDTESDNQIDTGVSETPKSPDEIERSVILRIVTRIQKK